MKLLPILFSFLLLSARALAQGEFREADPIPSEVERMYSKGVEFLVASQAEDGSFKGASGTEPAVVGFSVLAMLARGEDANTGLYASAIRRGVDYILKQQNSTNGYIGSSMYNHGFATLALAECYGAVENPRIGPALRKAVDFILTSQKTNPLGAWRYNPEGVDADSTVSGAQLVALYAARNAGLAVPQEAIDKGIAFILRCQTGDGGIGYTNANGPNAPRTAIGVLVLALARQQGTPQFKAAFRFLREGEPQEDSYHHYYLYYAAQAFFQASRDEFTVWNTANIEALARSQAKDGSWVGQFGPVFTTSASLLSLALNYRLLPIYER